jgi:hypothetical protein
MQSIDPSSAPYTVPGATQERRTSDGPMMGGVRWLGMNGDAAVSESSADRADQSWGSTLVLGAAHGPRLLELIRAAC